MFLGIDFCKQHNLDYNLLEDKVEFIEGWRTAAAIVARKTQIPANSSMKVALHTQSFPFSQNAVKGPINAICAVHCTETPILGKDQVMTIDKNGCSSVLIDNPLDIPVTLD